jgi:DNA repair and recombination RAD54-like protein
VEWFLFLIVVNYLYRTANDCQALARVWRDGQKKDCFVYRFIATGTIEEKIFQRQCHKQSLSSCVVDAEENVERHFSREYLQQLFQLNQNSACETHDRFKCKRCVGGIQFKKAAESLSDVTEEKETTFDPANWDHFGEHSFLGLSDTVLKACFKPCNVSFAFQFVSQSKMTVL